MHVYICGGYYYYLNSCDWQCMRENVGFRVQAAKDRLDEESLRCCLSDQLNQCGMMPQEV